MDIKSLFDLDGPVADPAMLILCRWQPGIKGPVWLRMTHLRAGSPRGGGGAQQMLQSRCLQVMAWHYQGGMGVGRGRQTLQKGCLQDAAWRQGGLLTMTLIEAAMQADGHEIGKRP